MMEDGLEQRSAFWEQGKQYEFYILEHNVTSLGEAFDSLLFCLIFFYVIKIALNTFNEFITFHCIGEL